MSWGATGCAHPQDLIRVGCNRPCSQCPHPELGSGWLHRRVTPGGGFRLPGQRQALHLAGDEGSAFRNITLSIWALPVSRVSAQGERIVF